MSEVRTVPTPHARNRRGSDGDEPTTIVVLGSKIVKSRGVEGAMAALEALQIRAGR